MTSIAGLTTSKLVNVLAVSQGVPAAVSAAAVEQGIRLPPMTADHILAQNATPELMEQSTALKYPVLLVYCDKIVNDLKEKFRTFSGEVEMLIEARVSQDRIDGLERNLQIYVDAIARVLGANRGDWGDGVSFNGAYQVNFGAMKHGGRNFLQIAKVILRLDVSAD